MKKTKNRFAHIQFGCLVVLFAFIAWLGLVWAVVKYLMAL